MEDIVRLSLPSEDVSSGVSYLKQFSVRETYRLHTHDFFEFFFIPKGKSIHIINQTTQILEQGSLVFIRPDDIHQYDFLNNDDMNIISCGVAPELIRQAFQYLDLDPAAFMDPPLPPVVILTGTVFRQITEKLDHITKTEPGIDRRTYFLSILPELLYLLMQTPPSQSDPLPDWLSLAIIEMKKPENFISGLDTMVGLAHVSQEHLTRACRRYLQMTPTEFINLQRIHYAVALLLEQRQSVLDTCLSSGFNNLSYFYRVFQRYYNCAPGTFVKNHIGDHQ